MYWWQVLLLIIFWSIVCFGLFFVVFRRRTKGTLSINKGADKPKDLYFLEFEDLDELEKYKYVVLKVKDVSREEHV